MIYVNHMGESINLEHGPIMIQDQEKLFSYEWKYTSGNVIKALSNFTKEIIEKECTVQIYADSIEEYKKVMEKFLKVTEQDILNEMPGKLYYNNYYKECYIIAGTIDNWEEDFYTTDKKIKIVAKDGTWIKEMPFSYHWNDQEADTTGKRYPYNYPYNYGMGGGYNSMIELESFGDMDFILTIYGYAQNPEICIGEQTYKVDYTIQPGEVLMIDSKNHKVFLVKTNGVTLNLFRYRDIRHYIFEKIASGNRPVYWNGAFDWDIQLFEERSEPKWM